MIIKCQICNKEFYIRPSDYKRNRRCCSSKCGCIRRIVLIGKDSPNWKGDNVGYAGVHAYVRRLKKKPRLCELCNKREAYDLANISQEYKRDLSDWEWLCRKCHMKKDGRVLDLIKNAIKGRNNRWENKKKYHKKFPFSKR